TTEISGKSGRSAPLVHRARGMARIAPLVGMPHIGDRRVGTFHLDLERRDQRVFAVDDDMAVLFLRLEADGKPHGVLRARSVPIPKFARACRTRRSELRNRRTLATL